MPLVRIPAAPVARGQFKPEVCVRHGAAATAMKRMLFGSLSPAWILLSLPIGGLLYLIITAFVRKDVVAPAWPWCRRCELIRQTRVLFGLGMFAAGIGLIGSLSDGGHGRGRLAGALVSLVCLIGALVVLTRATSAGAVAGVRVSGDGQWLRMRRAHERFAALVEGNPLLEPDPAAPAWSVVQPVEQAARPAVPGGAGGWTAPPP